MKNLLVSSGYGHNTKQPFVMIESAELDTPIQVSPQVARELALNILQAADAAESDAFIVGFLRDELNQEMTVIGNILIEFRNFREARRNE